MKNTKKQKFIEFTKDDEAITVNFIKDGIKVYDVLLGVAAIINIVVDETGKSKDEVLKIVNDVLDETRKKYNTKEGEKKDGSKQ